MAIHDEIRKCVIFLGYREGDRFIPCATGFSVSYLDQGFPFQHLVTAEHVVSRLITLGREIWARANLKDGRGAGFKLDHTTFRFHPNNAVEANDVAVAPLLSSLKDDQTGEVVEMDTRSIAMNGPNSMIATEQFLKDYDVGIGDEVFITGLFRSHAGQERNIPIVRIGNIAAMRGEPVRTKHGYNLDAYLIEARSVGGLSGSPVFVSTHPFRDFTIRRRLLGLMHGHFDIENLNEDVVIDDEKGSTTGIHTGVGVVVPVHKIIETIEHPDLSAMRDKRAKEMKESGEKGEAASR